MQEDMSNKTLLYVPEGLSSDFISKLTGSTIQPTDKYYNMVAFVEDSGEIYLKGKKFGFDGEDIVIVRYGESTYNDVQSAFLKNKLVICKNNNLYSFLTESSNTSFTFVYLNGSTTLSNIVSNNNTWETKTTHIVTPNYLKTINKESLVGNDNLNFVKLTDALDYKTDYELNYNSKYIANILNVKNNSKLLNNYINKFSWKVSDDTSSLPSGEFYCCAITDNNKILEYSKEKLSLISDTYIEFNFDEFSFPKDNNLWGFALIQNKVEGDIYPGNISDFPNMNPYMSTSIEEDNNKCSIIVGETKYKNWQVPYSIKYGVIKLDELFEITQVHTSNISILNTQVSTLTSEINILNTEISILNTDVSDIKSDISIINTDISVLTSEISVLNTKTDSLSVNKQDTLVSGTNIKTINNESILGEGNLEIDINDERRYQLNRARLDAEYAETLAASHDLAVREITSSSGTKIRDIGDDFDSISNPSLQSGDTVKLISTGNFKVYEKIIGSGNYQKDISSLDRLFSKECYRFKSDYQNIVNNITEIDYCNFQSSKSICSCFEGSKITHINYILPTKNCLGATGLFYGDQNSTSTNQLLKYFAGIDCSSFQETYNKRPGLTGNFHPLANMFGNSFDNEANYCSQLRNLPIFRNLKHSIDIRNDNNKSGFSYLNHIFEETSTTSWQSSDIIDKQIIDFMDSLGVGTYNLYNIPSSSGGSIGLKGIIAFSNKVYEKISERIENNKDVRSSIKYAMANKNWVFTNATINPSYDQYLHP